MLPAFVGPDRQRELIRLALCEQARDNETNLHVHYHLPEQGLWNAHLDSCIHSKETTVQPKGTPSGEQPKEGPRQLVDNAEASPETFNLIMSTPKPPQSPSGTLEPASASALMYKLRWANIGWFYHWGTKQYDFSKPRAPVDSIIKDLCRDAVETIDWDQVFLGSENEWDEAGPEWKTWNETYGESVKSSLGPSTEVASRTRRRDRQLLSGKSRWLHFISLVSNTLMTLKDTLMGHVDRSEVCATSPLVSIS